jgi:hypothetical protein
MNSYIDRMYRRKYKGFVAWKLDSPDLTVRMIPFSRLQFIFYFTYIYVADAFVNVFLEPDGRNNGYLQKLGNGSCYSMGSRGILTERGCSLSPISCATCGLWSSDCCCCSCLRLPPGLFEDFIYYLFNNHGFLSTICAERDNPYSRTERNFAFFGLGCLTFFGNVIAQIIGFSDTEGNKIIPICF